MASVLGEHLRVLQERWQTAMQKHGYQGVLLSAGDAQYYFQDDQGPRFKASPYFSQWVPPEFISPQALLFLQPNERAKLYLPQPTDYWHAVPKLPNFLEPFLDIIVEKEVTSLHLLCAKQISANENIAHIGEPLSNAFTDDNADQNNITHNPEALLNRMHFQRGIKTEYELIAMRAASEIGVIGHLAAEQAFHAGGTEFDIHMAYLAASAQNESALPYGNIVALNENGSILHYQHQQRSHAGDAKSLLIDAGGEYRGYASDITRTYACSGSQHAVFAKLVEAMEVLQQNIIAQVKPGKTFTDLHVFLHQQIATLLVAQNILNCSAEDAYAKGYTESFCPHGLGHLLGLQVHDVGGHLANEEGDVEPPPQNFSTLRYTRRIEQGQVFTIEPGIYFMPHFLQQLKADNAPVNWSLVDALIPYGGIRIEDNVHVTASGVENLTREAFLAVEALAANVVDRAI